MSNVWWNWGKIIYSIPLAITGVIYLVSPQSSVESLTSFVPGGLSLIYFAGVLWVILGLMMAFNLFTKYATWGVILLLLAYQIMVHIPAVYSGEHFAIVWFELLRDVSLLGGAFFILAIEGKENHAKEKEHLSLSIH